MRDCLLQQAMEDSARQQKDRALRTLGAVRLRTLSIITPRHRFDFFSKSVNRKMNLRI
jgi:hypothetical protein